MWRISWPNRLIFIWQTPKSYSKWPNFKVVTNWGWCSARFSFRTLIIFSYNNDSPEVLTSNIKFFADDTLIFSVVRDLSSSSLSLNEELSKISQWGTNGKCCLILMLQNKPKKLFSHAKKVLLTITTSTSITCSKTSRVIFRC